METRRILAINPGSTSTKIAVFQGDKSVFLKNIKHSNEELSQFEKISDQFEFRKNIIMKELIDAEIQIDLIEAVVGRGGLVKPIESGIYSVNERLKEDLRIGVLGEHASNLGGLIADNIAQALPKAKAYIADPVVVDEMIDVARISGHPEFQRVSIFHALNQKAIGRAFAQANDKKYEDVNVIVAHLGGGISVGAHCKGRVVDVNNALDGEGPFSPERSGTLPAGALAKLCFSGDYTLDDVKKMIKGEGGLVAHLGTNDAYDVELKAKAGDAKAKLIQDAMSYQVAKSIGAMSTVLKGKVDGILLTGGIAHNPDLVNYIKEMVSFIAPVAVYPGEDEMKALAMNGYMVLRGEIEPREYC
ncbi:butyrate kinase [Labilibaculum antarcticum]|jgi:butyrate kinase|uniref:Probable butyrate kinase n=1 Tax=Labilibaculum antarcticum TaxID=1717717 RepID=A0A1Y1CN94_9BACT|nr:butyrate kinase [Labilibaculum antarcticum]BAX81422.1 butyrate kinase [Labilibaculum antarcticum]